jgi:DNA-binding NarL/FixJ family response regulator
MSWLIRACQVSEAPVVAVTRIQSAVQRRHVKLRSLVVPQLGPRERDVLEQVARGLTNAEVGRRLHLSEKTVRNLVSSVLAKLPASRAGTCSPGLERSILTQAGLKGS